MYNFKLWDKSELINGIKPERVLEKYPQFTEKNVYLIGMNLDERVELITTVEVERINQKLSKEYTDEQVIIGRVDLMNINAYQQLVDNETLSIEQVPEVYRNKISV